jgi:hypothetical protein
MPPATASRGTAGSRGQAGARWRLVGVVPTSFEGVPPEMRRIPHGSAAAVLAPYTPGGPVRLDMRSHEEAVRRLFENTTILPARYGVLLKREESILARLMEPNTEALPALLEEMAGNAEVRLKVRQVEDVALRDIVRREPYLSYTGARRSQAQAIDLGSAVAGRLAALAEADRRFLLETLEPLALTVSGEGPASTALVLDVAYLVPKNRLTSFRQAATEATAQLSGRLEVDVRGPFPPYTFADVAVMQTWG